MMKASQLFRTLLILISTSIILGACVQTPPSALLPENDALAQGTAGTGTTLRFICSWGGVDSKAETLKFVLEQFEKANTDIKVINGSLFGEDFLPKIKTDFASGNDPDVFGLWPGSDINMLVKAGKVADLTGLLDSTPEWKSDFNPVMWSYTTYDSKIYGLPFEIIFECMFINKDLFSKFDIKIPENYDELKDAVIAFKNHDIIPIAFNTEAEGTYLYQNLIPVIGGKDDTERPFIDGRIKQSHITAMDMIKELYDLGAFPGNCFTMSNNERNVLFKEKKAAMIVQGSWYIGDFDALDTTVDIIPFPYVKGYEDHRDTMVYGLGGGTFHMSSASWDDADKHSASVRLLRYLTSAETAAVFASRTGMISNVSLKDYNIEYRSMTVKGMQMLDDAKNLVGPLDSFVDRTAWEKYIADQFPYFLSGSITAEEMWDRAIKNGIILDY